MPYNILNLDMQVPYNPTLTLLTKPKNGVKMISGALPKLSEGVPKKAGSGFEDFLLNYLLYDGIIL